MERWVYDLIAAMPKAELHLHLDGALRVKTALDLAAEGGLQGLGIYGFKELHERMVVTRNLTSQEELLAYFEVPGILLQTSEALKRVSEELILDKAADGVRYCEIRFAPLLHLQGGLSLQEVMEAVLEGCSQGQAQTGVYSVLIAVGMRSMSLEENLAMLEGIAPYRSKGVVGVDFAGLEAKHPDILAQGAYFQRAKELGFYTTFHCGEVASSGQMLREGVINLNPNRIAHGAIAAEDEYLCHELRCRNIMLDLCPASNIQAGLYADYKAYPLEQLYRLGVPVSISTDDPVLSGITLSDEYRHVLEHSSLTLRDLWQINLNALGAGFAGSHEKEGLRCQFEDWAKNVPELTLCQPQ